MGAFQAQTSPAQWTPLRIAAAVVGAVLLVVGVLGFIPGSTTNYDSMEWAGQHSDAQLLGLFAVSILHNIVHLLFGVAGLLACRTALASRAFLLGGGLIYLVQWLYGMVTDQHSDANFVPVNTADNWLHFALGAGMVAIGVLLGFSGSSGITGSPRPSIQ